MSIQMSDIPGIQPTVAIQYFSRFFKISVIALHYIRTFHVNYPVFPVKFFPACFGINYTDMNSLKHRPYSVKGLTADNPDGYNRTGLREPVAFNKFYFGYIEKIINIIR